MTVKEVVLQLRTVDLDRALDFYMTKLGFTLSFRYEDFYAGIENGGRVIHLKQVDTPDPSISFVRDGGHLHLYLTVDDLEKVFEGLQQAGVTIVEDISRRPWDRTEFVIEESRRPHHLLRADRLMYPNLPALGRRPVDIMSRSGMRTGHVFGVMPDLTIRS